MKTDAPSRARSVATAAAARVATGSRYAMSGGNGKRPPGYWPVAVRGKLTWSLTHSAPTRRASASRQNVVRASRVATDPWVGRWHPMSMAPSDLRVAAAARLGAPAPRLVDPPELLEDLLAVGDASGDLVE